MLKQADEKPARPFIKQQALRVLLSIGFATLAGPCEGHRDRMKDVDHLISIKGTSTEITIEVVLHFHEISSLQTRAGRMDRNQNGVITARELDAYCSAVGKPLQQRYQLTVEEKPVPLIPLYRAEVDLLDSPRVVQVPHLLKLFLVGQLPAGLTAGAALTFEDRSFAAIPGLSRIEVRRSGDAGEAVLASSNSRSLTFTFEKLTGFLKGESSP